MDVQPGPFNLTEAFAAKYPVANMIFHNKTLILVARKHSSSANQQLALLVGMAFIGGIVAGFLVRCIYQNAVKYFRHNTENTGSPRPSGVSVISSADDQPPDYVTVMADPLAINQDGNIKPCKERTSNVPEENPPEYANVVVDTPVRETRSATT